MKRFYNRPSNANSKFSRLAYKVHGMNMTSGFYRGGIRLG